MPETFENFSWHSQDAGQASLCFSSWPLLSSAKLCCCLLTCTLHLALQEVGNHAPRADDTTALILSLLDTRVDEDSPSPRPRDNSVTGTRTPHSAS